MRTGFLLHLASSPPSPSPSSSVPVTWCVGSGRWVCLIACGFIHNYSLYLKPKLKYADGAGCRWTASNGVYSRVSPILAPHTHTHWSGYTDLQLCSRFNVVLFHYVIGGIGDTADSRSQHLIYWGMSEARAGVLSWAPTLQRVRHMKAPGWLIVIYSPQAEIRRRRDMGLSWSAGFRRRGEDAAEAAAAADAEAAERRRLQRIAVVGPHRAERSTVNNACIDRKMHHIWSTSSCSHTSDWHPLHAPLPP